ncbi:BTB/POZ and MATH domain-containing protein 2-like [Aegilops tauschii subsp. strangulata]|uniref:BTB/POZ and MATH domain-containing protein 2-like n=1 Tax=Aegilops tauschii subsp. strangulata TaxID=200361 RepID=UPI00098B41E1|nr:BTB/POZ and MATH domain-containing protein 2-like [Aegilops tauschii subsp. strangulata]
MQGAGRKKGGARERSSEARKNVEELKRIMTGVEKLDKRSDELRVEPFPSPALARGADLALRLLEGEIRRPPQEVRQRPTARRYTTLWRIKYYPNGQGSDNANYISVFIQLASVSMDLPFKPDKGISAQCVLSLLDRAGKPVPSYTLTFDRIFTTPQGEWGWHKFITRSKLENSGCLKDDYFTLRCDITVTELRAEETEDRDFTDLLWKKEGADVGFHVGGETIVAHRWVMAARSPILKAAAEAELLGMLEREKKAPMATVRIDDMEAKMFKALLHYIYTDALPIEMDKGDEAATAMAHGLHEAADRYKMERLKLICEDMLCKRVSTGTAITTLVLAEQQHRQRLKAACIDFLISPNNMKVILENGGFKHLQRSCPSVLMDLIGRVKVA